jgi:hypothetical protein
MPILLPDCGHSFCFACIQGCFELLRSEQTHRDKELIPDCNCKQTSPTAFLDEEQSISAVFYREECDTHQPVEY